MNYTVSFSKQGAKTVATATLPNGEILATYRSGGRVDSHEGLIKKIRKATRPKAVKNATPKAPKLPKAVKNTANSFFDFAL